MQLRNLDFFLDAVQFHAFKLICHIQRTYSIEKRDQKFCCQEKDWKVDRVENEISNYSQMFLVLLHTTEG